MPFPLIMKGIEVAVQIILIVAVAIGAASVVDKPAIDTDWVHLAEEWETYLYQNGELIKLTARGIQDFMKTWISKDPGRQVWVSDVLNRTLFLSKIGQVGIFDIWGGIIEDNNTGEIIGGGIAARKFWVHIIGEGWYYCIEAGE